MFLCLMDVDDIVLAVSSASFFCNGRELRKTNTVRQGLEIPPIPSRLRCCFRGVHARVGDHETRLLPHGRLFNLCRHPA